MCKEWVKIDCQKEHGKQKVAEEEEEDQSCDGKTVSNETWKGQVRTAKSGRPPQKTGKWRTLTMKVEAIK